MIKAAESKQNKQEVPLKLHSHKLQVTATVAGGQVQQIIGNYSNFPAMDCASSWLQQIRS